MLHDLCVQLVPLFDGLALDDQMEIQRKTRFRAFGKGDIVFSPASEPQLTIVARGSMKVYRISPNGREQLLRVVEPGGYEGEARLFENDGADDADAAPSDNLYGEALADTKVCILRRSDFMELLGTHPQLSLRLLSAVAGKMARAEEQTQFLAMGRVEERLATYLLDLSRGEGGSPRIRIPMTMRELASYLGTTPETLSRKLRFLEEEGYIARRRRDIFIRDPRRLGGI
ncbi:Crp/Fnr family transcriptional regulator [Pseudoscardovia suis]